MARASWTVGTTLLLVVACSDSEILSRSEALSTWTVADEPTISIGGDEDGVDPLFQVAGAVKTASGYVIVNRSAHEVRLYDGTGQFIEQIGGEGAGPGAFRYPSIAGVLGDDSVVVHDSSNRRITIICRAFEICREQPLMQRGQVVGVGGDYAVLTLESYEEPFVIGEQRRPYHVLIVNRSTLKVDTLLTIPGQPRQVGHAGATILVTPIPMTRSPQVTVSSDAIIIANGQDARFRIVDFSGIERRVVELPIELQGVDPKGFDIAARENLRLAAERRPELLGLIDHMRPPDHKAPIRRMLTDREDLIWIELDRAQDQVHEWLVADLSGRVRAAVTTPPHVDVLDVGDDYVLGLARDSLAVEYVQLYRLERR